MTSAGAITLIEVLAYVVAVVLGLSVGSFLNVIADRLPRGESVISPPSHCASCGRRLAPFEIIPVVSYVVLRGHCRSCKAAIGIRVLLVEIGGAVIAVAAWRIYGPTLPCFIVAVEGWIFLVLSVLDIENHRVYSLILVPALVFALLASPWWPPAGVVSALLGAVVAFVPYALFYVIAGRFYGRGKGLGLGDVKVSVLMGLVAGFPGAIVALYGAILAGGVVAVVVLVSGRRRRMDAVATVPFLAVGTLAGVLWSSGYLPFGR
jgi:leader peptidase (prepilin peptidase)/N-methyltransferase